MEDLLLGFVVLLALAGFVLQKMGRLIFGTETGQALALGAAKKWLG